MSDLFNNFFKQVASGSKIKDYKHASRLFVDNNYRLSPKYGWLFHVFIDLNPELTNIKDSNALTEAGMLVKSVGLPKFSVSNKTFNEYNRPNIVQTKVGYDPIQITFHDDQANVVRNFWQDYFKYYYRDTDIGYSSSSGQVNPSYHAPAKYNGSNRDMLNRFGYSPRTFDSRSEQQYIHAIRIYSLYQKKFAEYTLVNPTITNFEHGNHDAGGNGILESTMTVAYETMLYASGYVTPNVVKGFADLHYDKSPSPLTPLGGGTNSIFGPGGILNAVDDIVKSGASGNYGAAAFTLLKAVQNNKNVDLRGLAKTELIQAGLEILSGRNPLSQTFIPNPGSQVSTQFPGIQNAPNTGIASPGSIFSNGSSLNLGGAVATAGVALGALGAPSLASATTVAVGAFISTDTGKQLTQNIKGAVFGTNNNMAGGAINTIYNVDKTTNQVTSSESPPTTNYLAESLLKYQLKKTNQVAAINPSAASIQPVAFVTGTNTIIPGSPVDTARATVAASEAQKFVDSGNPIQIAPAQSYAGVNLGGSTNPEPPTNIG